MTIIIFTALTLMLSATVFNHVVYAWNRRFFLGRMQKAAIIAKAVLAVMASYVAIVVAAQTIVI